MNKILPLAARLRKLPYAIAGGFLLLVTVGVMLPSTLTVEGDTTIDAGAATVFALLNDFRQINKWSSRFDIDPNARLEISGPRRGAGARMQWNGNIVGAGSQTILESVPYERVTSELELGENRVARSAFVLSTDNNHTLVSWRYEREFGLNIFGRLLGLLQGSSIEDEFEQGLRNLRVMAESLPRADFSDLQVEHIDVDASDIAYLTASSDPLAAAIAEATGDAYFTILNFIDDRGLKEAGAPIIISRGFSGSKLMFDAGIPVQGVTPGSSASSGPVRLGKTYAGPVIRVRHQGSYAYLSETHARIASYLAALGIERNGDAWESYVSDPTRVAESDLLTYVYYPVRD